MKGRGNPAFFLPAYNQGLSRVSNYAMSWRQRVEDLTYTRLLTPEVQKMAKCNSPGPFGPCRKCPSCLQARLRQWVLRMILEAMLYDDNQCTFCTFTYRPEDLPASEVEAREQMQKFLKRLRRVFNTPGNIRYVAALEKGAMATKRYHWHAILYGLRFTANNRDILERAWSHGFIQWKPSTPGRMAYVLKYVIKGGKFLMSRNPGIGDGMIEYLNKTCMELSDEEVEKVLQKDSNYLFRVFFTPEKIKNSDVHINKKTGEEKKSSLIRSSTMSAGMSADKAIKLSHIKVGGYSFSLHRFIKEQLIDLRRKK